MLKSEFQKLAEEKILILDGATGSELQKKGMPSGVCPEQWILEHRSAMIEIQKNYVRAGSNIVYAPTFTANRIKLSEYGLEEEIREINLELVKIAKEAVGEDAFVAGDLTMTGEQLAPIGSMEFEALIEIYKEQIEILEEAGVDLLVIETMMSLQESRAALIAAKETCELPVMVTLTFQEDGKTLYGTDPATAMVVLQSLGADAVGLNCSTGPDQMVPLVEAMKAQANIPVIAKPNAGLPKRGEDGSTTYDMGVEEFVVHMKKLIEAGASIVGGCCGSSPEYIKELSQAAKEMPHPEISKQRKRVVASERQMLEIGLEDNFLIVGERINPTGKKKLQAQLREGDYEMVLDFAREQAECGAGILDVNVGMNGIDEKQTMLEVLEEVTFHENLPISIDSSSVEVVEAALRRYPGRALINSISLEKVKFENLLPIARKYGAMFILLPLSDKGLPESLEEKKDIIHTVMNRALELGFVKEDIVVDGLVATVGANPKAALETIETIRYCKEELELATICGLSNISFGLPDRAYVNAIFLSLAIQAGLTMAIANPSQELLVRSAFAADLLLNKEDSDIRYIEKTQFYKERAEQRAAEEQSRPQPEIKAKAPVKKAEEAASLVPKDLTAEESELYDGVMKGKKKQIVALSKAAVDAGSSPSKLLNEVLIPAINAVGKLFEQQKYFLPQLIMSAETMETSIAFLEPMMEKKEGEKEKATIVIATVQGDIHDIGKNLVALMLKNYGYRVIDLGKDVPKETIVETAIRENAKIIGLSALMTTTMQEMKHVAEYAKSQGCKAKIIIGGAVITQSYADEIQVEGYSKDAADAVKLVDRILEALDE